MIGVVAYLVSVSRLAHYKLRKIFGVLTDDEERRAYIVQREQIEYLRRFSRMRTVVKRQGDAFPAAVRSGKYHVAVGICLHRRSEHHRRAQKRG